MKKKSDLFFSLKVLIKKILLFVIFYTVVFLKLLYKFVTSVVFSENKSLYTDYVCPNCGNSKKEIINTYKHHWLVCCNCKTVIRKRKSAYLFDTPIFQSLISKQFYLKQSFYTTLLSEQEVVERESAFYDYYTEILKTGIKGTMWEKYAQQVFDKLKKHNIQIEGKNILDISGGPGHLSSQLQKTAGKLVITEFSHSSARAMREVLSLDVVKFDYNTDNIGDCVKGTFDIIFINYSIGFCDNLEAFLKSLKNHIHNNTIVYIGHSPDGTLGLCVRWQYDEYTYNRCWNADVLAKRFSEIGMKEIIREEDRPSAVLDDWPFYKRDWLTKIHAQFLRFLVSLYVAKALRSNNKCTNMDLKQHFVLQVFKATASS